MLDQRIFKNHQLVFINSSSLAPLLLENLIKIKFFRNKINY